MEHQPPPRYGSLFYGKNSWSTPKGSYVVDPEKCEKTGRRQKSAVYWTKEVIESWQKANKQCGGVSN